MPNPFVPMPKSPPEVEIPFSAAGQRARFPRVYSLLDEAIRTQAFPGASFGVLADNEIVALDGVGRFTYENASPPVTSRTVYDLASITKVLATTSMTMLLYQKGQLELDQPLIGWLPEFAAGESAEGERHRVTLRMLLAHSSGLPGYSPLFARCANKDSLFAACLRQPLEAQPGSRSEYSDLGFILLGRILELIAGESLDRYCAREIFAPLGMSSACFGPPPGWAQWIAPTEIDSTFRGRKIQGEVQDENCFVLGGVSGHAGLFSNAIDLLRYARSLIQTLSSKNNSSLEVQCASPFNPETIDLFISRAELPPGSSRALGWDTPSQPSSSGKFFSRRSAGHLGYAGTSLWIDFERRVAVALLTNRTWPSRESKAIQQVRPALHDAIMTAL